MSPLDAALGACGAVGVLLAEVAVMRGRVAVPGAGLVRDRLRVSPSRVVLGEILETTDAAVLAAPLSDSGVDRCCCQRGIVRW